MSAELWPKICLHCAGWGKPNVPSTHLSYGKRCEPCDGTGNEPLRRGFTTIFGYATNVQPRSGT